ncbi:hypothetical protein WB874_000988 [Vibrio vulnificus]|nr:hypothetical protein [Vibrio vulnificus]EHS1185850.1 hypothetical protein [Vibrio vulnificus]EIX4879349.1 hypothetical protein [Vibrio vulnificus]ELM0326506.1 hypothetical protein [Vibrio vulnificus]
MATHSPPQTITKKTNNTDNEALKLSHGARYTMDPRVRKDAGVRELIGTTHLSFPCIRESIHPQAAEAEYWQRTHNNRQKLKRNQQQHWQ